jgi:hypothetical protein
MEGLLPIPPINLGVVGIRDLVGHVGVSLPLSGGAAILNLGVGTVKDPFSVTILAAGGGGWLDLDLSADPASPGLVRLSAGLAVTYSAGLNIVVAKVSITATIGGGIELVSGEVTLLFFVSIEVEAALLGAKAYVSATLYLEYKPATKKLKGIVTVTARFSILGESVSKSFDVEQEFELGNGGGQQAALSGGGAAMPRTLAFAGTSGSCFEDQFPTQADWTAYTEAFA